MKLYPCKSLHMDNEDQLTRVVQSAMVSEEFTVSYESWCSVVDSGALAISAIPGQIPVDRCIGRWMVKKIHKVFTGRDWLPGRVCFFKSLAHPSCHSECASECAVTDRAHWPITS